MQLTVTVDNSETILTIDFPEELTLQDFVAYLEDQLALQSFIIFHNGLPLSDKEASLSSLGLSENDIILVKPNSLPAAPVTSTTNASLSHPLGFYPEAELDPIQRSIATAMEHNPESFVRTTMLYIPVTIHPNGHSLDNPVSKAFVDTGAQTSIISPDFCEKIGISNLIDKRFKGEVRGVGKSNILGRIHDVEVAIGDALIHLAFTVIDTGMDLLLGLDMMRKFGMCIDLRENCLRVDGLKVSFLDENEVPSTFNDLNNGQQLGSGNIFTPGAFNNPQTSASQAAAQAAQARITPSSSVSDDSIAQLVSLGFPRQEAIRALQQCNGNVEVAASLLFQ